MSLARSGGRVQPARAGDPKRVGTYRIIGRLGAGGMGTVHAGLDPAGLRVAVKVVHPAHAEDPEFRARFRREVQLSARVQGPCLIPLLAADPDAETPWLATAYAPGLTLEQHLAVHGPLSGGTLYAFATGTARALAAIHAADVVHRDVKPQNVILTPAGPRVLDFGIAHAADGTSVTRTGVMTGTPGWISPEHYRTGTAGPEGDVFAWGALVSYAATGRLPFGTGAPDVVAYRVMSGDPDLDGLPGELRRTVEKALAKSPDERMTAGSAAEECARLLATQATHVLTAGAGPGATRADHLVTGEWNVPGVEDPAWRTPAASTRKRALMAAVAAAAAGTAVAGSIVAFDTKDRVVTGTAPSSAVSASPLHGASAATDSSSIPAEAMTATPVDARTVRVPTDPLAGVPDPAYTRSGDETQPHPDEWRTSATAGSPREREAEQSIRDRMTSMLATKDMAFMKPTVTFNLRAQTLIVTGGPVPQLPDHYREVFRRAAQMAVCTVLAHRLKNAPTTWPYGRFSVYWKTSDGDVNASAIGYGTATDGCFTEIAGQWRGDESGMATAEIPSSDKAEIRVADATAKAVTATWNTNTAETNEAPINASDGITLGFDPVENAAYVWTDDPDNRFASRASQSNLKGAVEEAVCRKIIAEFNSNRSWNYTHWAVAVYNPYTNERQFIGSGTCTP
ncbi:serine/threonine-protein kinase [Streptomyces sp. NBC_01443]|uniref:serine/threonine-protein kinase n=1 Tax=Streptomyces sp. NBC_01443 TaxID=2903868 RepID=UPI00224FF1AF|nr:serine/threonine-protein kinase [Streptomyces sp. NBC_01443]MCX4626476.1 serine/threonine protein kinase [Streptomyces sp. NBC_01443]